MTTVPKDPMPAPVMVPEMFKKAPITGKGQVDSMPPSQGIGPLGVPPTTGDGKATDGGSSLNQPK